MKKLIISFAFFLIVQCFLITENCEAQWVQCEDIFGGSEYALILLGDNIFVGTLYSGVYLSTNDGTNWTQTSLSNVTIYSLATLGNNIFAGMGYGNGVYRSTNNGTNWTQSVFSYYPNINALAAIGNNIIAGTSYGIYFSTNNGTNWNLTSMSIGNTYSLAVSGNNIFAGLDGGGVFISTNNGMNWTQTSLNNKTVLSLAVSGNNIYAGTGTSGSIGVYLSTNNGVNWNHIGLSSSTVYSLAVSGNNIFAGTNNGVYLSTNNGVNWVIKNQGLNNYTSVYAVLIANNYIFAGTFERGVWRRSLSEIIGIQNINSETPSSFKLEQNYPNPFNPTTTIKYAVVKLSDVKIVVYDVMGREVQTLVNESLKPGTYETTFDGSQLTSGVYFYKLLAGDFVETKKMLLLK